MHIRMSLRFVGAFALVVCLTPRPAHADLKTTEVFLAPKDVNTHAPQDSTLGSFYTLRFQVPAVVDSANLQSAVLEFYADISTKPIDGWTNDTPVVEVYALKAAYSGQLDQSSFRKPSPMVRPIRLGTKKRTVMNVTEVVRSYIADPSKNHGLILGSFRGSREGMFTLRNDQLEGGAVAKITFLYVEPRAE